jgi:hypothetical protein
LPRTVVTPLAADELRARGVRIRYEEAAPVEAAAAVTPGQWGYTQEGADPAVDAAVQALARDGVALRALAPASRSPWEWAQAVAECIARAECAGGVVFCGDPALVCCVANKLSGLRAAAVLSVAQATRARAKLGANLLAVEMPGRTFFEVRQILKAACGNGAIPCPPDLAAALKELDGHAHR